MTYPAPYADKESYVPAEQWEYLSVGSFGWMDDEMIRVSLRVVSSAEPSPRVHIQLSGLDTSLGVPCLRGKGGRWYAVLALAT